MASSRSQRRRQPVRSPQRRPSAARVLEPPDYSRDYAYVRQDLILIAVIGGAGKRPSAMARRKSSPLMAFSASSGGTPMLVPCSLIVHP